MWYAIIGGSGLFVGLALLIWGLTERGKRHAAERKADEQKALATSARMVAKSNAENAQRLESERERMSKQLLVVRDRLGETQRRLAESGDPKAIKAWLDEELKGETL
jgi:hypothetical protein